MSRALDFAASTFRQPSVEAVANICLLRFDTETVSGSTTVILSTPLRIKASKTYPPTPPTPKIIYFASESLCIESLPNSSSVRENASVLLYFISELTSDNSFDKVKFAVNYYEIGIIAFFYLTLVESHKLCGIFACHLYCLGFWYSE